MPRFHVEWLQSRSRGEEIFRKQRYATVSMGVKSEEILSTFFRKLDNLSTNSCRFVFTEFEIKGLVFSNFFGKKLNIWVIKLRFTEIFNALVICRFQVSIEELIFHYTEILN